MGDEDAGTTPDLDASDFNYGFRWAEAWETMFASLYIVVMAFSFALYFCLLRAVALNPRKETPTYFYHLFLFFTSVIECGLVVEQLMTVLGLQVHSTGICGFVTFVEYGNKILQASVVVALAYSTALTVHYKTAGFENNVLKKYFPIIILGLLKLEVVLTLWPALNVKGAANLQYCYYKDSSKSTVASTGWLYLVIFPYFLPLILIVAPVVYLSIKLKKSKTETELNMKESSRNHVKVTLATTVGYFFFHLLYYILMLGRESEYLILDKSEFRTLISLHVWYITRPMFALIGYAWHITTPLAPFVMDDDFIDVFPGNWFNRNRHDPEKRWRQRQRNRIDGGDDEFDQDPNSIGLTPTTGSGSSSMTRNSSSYSNASTNIEVFTKVGDRTEINFDNFQPSVVLEEQEEAKEIQ